MENNQRLEKKQKSKIDIIVLKEEIDGINWNIKVCNNNSVILVNDSGYELNVGNIDLYISTVKWLIMSINRDSYTLDEKEIIKRVIYQYLKLETLYKRNEKSQILESIELNNEISECIKEYAKKEIEEITQSTFGNLELIQHLKNTLEVNDTLLDEEVLRSIVRCNDSNSVRRISKELINNSKEKIEFQLLKLKDKFSRIGDYYVSFKSGLWDLRFSKASLTLHTIWLLTITGAFITGGVMIPKVLKNGGSREYKGIVESVSSLGEKETLEDYFDPDTPSKILEVYSETYESDGLYYKDVSTYDFSSFETTSELEKYFSVDLEFMNLKPISTDTVLVENEYEGEYKVFKKTTLDLDDKIMLNTTVDKIVRFGLGTFWYLVLIIFAGCPGMPLHQLSNVLNRFYELDGEKYNFEKDNNFYLEMIKEIEQYLKSNNIELGDILKTYDEIEVLARLDGLTKEEIEIIRKCEELKKETDEISSSEAYEMFKKLLKKHS